MLCALLYQLELKTWSLLKILILSKLMNFTLVCKRYGLWAERIPNTNKWRGILGGVLEGELELGHYLAQTAERDEFVKFSTPLGSLSMVFILRKPGKSIHVTSIWSSIDWKYVVAFAGLNIALLLMLAAISFTTSFTNPSLLS